MVYNLSIMPTTLDSAASTLKENEFALYVHGKWLRSWKKQCHLTCILKIILGLGGEWSREKEKKNRLVIS